MQNNKYHETVLINEVLKHMPTGNVIDCTLGTGGHTLALVESGRKVISIEADPKMIEIARERLGNKAVLILDNFVNLKKILENNNLDMVDGILFDLGVSNLHLKSDTRGFSFSEESQDLDMRLNPEVQGVKASDLLNALNIGQLEKLFSSVMNPGLSKKWAKAVVDQRPFTKVSDLKELAFRMPHKNGIDSATLPMLALRIAVNSEYDNLAQVLPDAFNLLNKNGKLLIITFHSGEEYILNKYLGGPGRIVFPSSDEISSNPRSRSAKLHIYEKS